MARTETWKTNTRVTAEGRRMEKSSKRGKIPQHDWPSIIQRYEAGETLASIARTYDCSPPAISYIVSRTRARNAVPEATGQTAPAIAPVAAEPQLLKGPIVEMPTDNIPAGETLHGSANDGPKALAVPDEARLIEQSANAPQPNSSVAQPNPVAESNQRGLFPEDPPQAQSSRPNHILQGGNGSGPRHGHAQFSDPRQAGNGSAPRPLAPAATPPQNGESRRTLHLSLSQGNGGPHVPDPLPPNTPAVASFGSGGSGDRFPPRPPAGPPTVGQPSSQGQTAHYSPPGPAAAPVSGNGAPNRPPSDGQRIKEGGAFIDRALRERVDGDIAAFLAAFDAALDHDTSESRTELREATDRLLRAGARTRIELERLEARAPLPSRDKTGQTAPLFRHR
jgi:hypothetical protein